MKPRHSAAFALIGWYLLFPPIIHDRVVKDARLSTWENGGAYDTAAECEHMIAELLRRVEKVNSNHPSAIADPLDRRIYSLACVATDDPRLAR